MIDVTKTKKAIKNTIKNRLAGHEASLAPSPTYQANGAQPVDCEMLIIGAGIAGIGMASRLQQFDNKKTFGQDISKNTGSNTNNTNNINPNATERFILLEKRADLGGTWDLFNYPGIRSDSDALTFGYSFRPWLDSRMLASGSDIKDYISKTAREFKIVSHIRYRHEVEQLAWSSETKQWTATVINHANGERLSLTAHFVVGATGYYNFEQGYKPDYVGEADFAGLIVHPQKWQDVDYHNKKIVLIGSGATAVTLLPALVDASGEQTASHVTMLQRSPSYIASVPADDYAMETLSGKLSPLSKQQAYKLVRARNVLVQQATYRASVYAPKLMKALMSYGVKKELKSSEIDLKHFSPDYNPWDQRVCAVPDSDFFTALQSGSVAIVTDEIDRFTETGILLKSGEHLDADIIISATGLNLQVLGGAKVVINGEEVDIGQRMTYKAVMLEEVPNMAVLFGYTNASWTLKIDIACQYVLRLISYMNQHHYRVAMAKAQADGENVQMQEDTVLGSLSAGYVARASKVLPKQGDRYPWQVINNYLLDRIMLKYRKINDKWLHFTR